jgi:hypothetical protein
MGKMKTAPRKMKNKEIVLTPNEGTIFYYRNHPTIAARHLLGIKLNWIQRIALKAIWTIPFVMLVWGRRNGKTFIGAITSVLRAMLYPNERVVIVAPSKRQVDFVFNNEFDILYRNSSYFRSSIMGKGIIVTNAYDRIKFTNGSVIEGYPVGTDGSKIRGAGMNFLWIDEYAQMSESVINLVFKPMLAVKKKGSFNRYLITSSAFYKWNHMWSLFQYWSIKQSIEPHKYCVLNYNYKHLLLSDNLPFEFDMNIVKEAEDVMTELEYKMEWLAIFPDESEGFFSSKLVEDSTPRPPDKKPINIEMQGDGVSDYYMGVDVGRAEGGSNFSISIVKKLKMHAKLVHVITANGATFQEMSDMVRRLFIKFNIKKINLDAGGGGTTLKDLLREKWRDLHSNINLKPIVTLDDNVEGIPALYMIKFTDEKHNNLHMNLKSELEHNRLLLPIDLRRDSDKDLERVGQEIIAFKTELQVMTAKPKGRYLRFEVPNKFRTDRVISTALAIDCYLGDTVDYYEEELAVGGWVGS